MSVLAPEYHDVRARGGVADLSDRVVLRFTGADRVRYLNGQLTRNVTSLPPGAALPACVCSARGKLEADVWITARPDAILLDAPPELAETLAGRLGRYIIADDVEVADETGQGTLLHCFGWDPRPLEVTAISARRFGVDGWDVWTGDARTNPAADHSLAGRELLDLLCIERGVPQWGRELDGGTLPPEAGLDQTHIDYHKGCYIGQEVISRLRSVGHVNRTLRGFTAAQELAAGMELFTPAGPGAVGRITSAAWSIGLDQWAALGYLKRGTSPAGMLARLPAAGSASVDITDHPLPLLA